MLADVAVLRQVWVQQYCLKDGQVKWRTKDQFGQPRAHLMIAQRAGVEEAISHAVHDMGVRVARYRGLVRTHLQHVATAAAINLRRLAEWLAGERPEPARKSPCAALASPICLRQQLPMKVPNSAE